MLEWSADKIGDEHIVFCGGGEGLVSSNKLFPTSGNRRVGQGRT